MDCCDRMQRVSSGAGHHRHLSCPGGSHRTNPEISHRTKSNTSTRKAPSSLTPLQMEIWTQLSPYRTSDISDANFVTLTKSVAFLVRTTCGNYINPTSIDFLVVGTEDTRASIVLVVHQPDGRFKKIVEGKTREAFHRVKENEFTIEGEGLRLRQEMFTNFGKSDKIMIPVKVKKVKVSSKSRDSKVEVPVTIKKAKVDVNEYDEATSEGISMILPRHGRESINSIRML